MAIALILLTFAYLRKPRENPQIESGTTAGHQGYREDFKAANTVGSFAQIEGQANPVPRDLPQRQSAEHSVKELYGPVLPALKLSVEESDKLYSLLVEREQCKLDAGFLQSADIKMAGQKNAAVTKTLHEFDEDLRAQFSPQAYQKIKQMLDATLQLNLIANTYAPQLRVQGYALSPEQQLNLAVVFSETYDPRLNPEAKLRDSLPIDPESKLSPLDEMAFRRLDKVLSAPQLQYLRARVAAGNRAARAK